MFLSVPSYEMPFFWCFSHKKHHVWWCFGSLGYTLWAKEVNRLENVIGWYHSHPSYGCWLSGIDVDRQMQNQQYHDPFVAIVVGKRMRFDCFGSIASTVFRLIRHELYLLVKWISAHSERIQRAQSGKWSDRISTDSIEQNRRFRCSL